MQRDNLDERLKNLERSHQGLMSQYMALETLCMTLLPLIASKEEHARLLMDLAGKTLAHCMAGDGLDAGFRKAVEDRLDTLQRDVLAAAPVVDRIELAQ